MKKHGRFIGQLTGTKREEDDTWFIREPFFFERPNGDVYMVPAGWYTDLKSGGEIPFFPEDDPYSIACALHDFLYGGNIVPRKLADVMMLEGCLAIPEVPRWKAWVMYYAVRLFGEKSYRSNTQEHVATLRHLIGEHWMRRPLWPDGKPHYKKEILEQGGWK